MKNELLILVTLFTLTFISCDEGNVETQQTGYDLGFGRPMEIKIVDGCEYLFQANGNASLFTHKGNCKNHAYKPAF